MGELPVAELLIAASIPILIILFGRKIASPDLLPVYGLVLLWLGGQVTTDIYRGTALSDWMRGDGGIVLFLIDIVAIVAITLGNLRRKMILITSFGIGSLLAARLQPSVISVDDPWKFGYAEGFNTLIAMASCYFYSRRNYLGTGILLSAIVIINLAENFRTPVLYAMVAMAVILPIFPERVGKLRLLPREGSIAKVLVLICISMIAAVSAAGLIQFATARGIVSDAAKLKNLSQSQSTGGIMLGGRPEILVSTRAVLDSPLLGHGSWARDFKYTEMLSDIQERRGIETDLEDLEENFQGLIPAHSHLMGAWVQAGICGAVFWVYVFFLALKAMIRNSILRPPIAPIYAFMLIQFLWDILFSPFSSTRRVTEALMIVITLDLIRSFPVQTRLGSGMRSSRWKRNVSARFSARVNVQA